MKNCPKCEIEHEKHGIFCSRKCANSRGPRSQEFKNIVSKKLTGIKQTEERKLKNTGSNNGMWKGGNLQYAGKCIFCEKECSRYRKFCISDCYIQYLKTKKSQKQNYKNECQFKFNVYDYPHKYDLYLIEEYGWYSAANRGNNQTGVQRDHMYSIKDGFDNNIDPTIISHPANCKLVCNFENQKKHSSSSITLEELLERIDNW